LASSANLSWWTQYVANWNIVATGDFTGDGRADIVAQAPDKSATYLFTIDNQGDLTSSTNITSLVGAGQSVVGLGNLAGSSTRASDGTGDVVDLYGVTSGAINTGSNIQTGSAASGGAGLSGSGASTALSPAAGTDNYAFAPGGGQATIVNGSAAGTAPSGELAFTGGVTDEQVWLQQSGNNLVVELMGGRDQVTVQGWYTNPAAQLQDITAGGQILDGQLNTLVAAMASFAASHPGFDPTAAANAQAPNDPTLQAAIAAAWHR
jgi:hypothetical protein